MCGRQWSLLLLTMLLIIGEGKVIELDTTNWESTISSSTWTAVLFYDDHDKQKFEDHVELFKALEAEDFPELVLARLSIRQHQYLRHIYFDEDYNDPPFLAYFYDSRSASSLTGISASTFMQEGDVYWETNVVLLGDDFHCYGQMSLDYDADVAQKVNGVAHWLERVTADIPFDTEIIIEEPISRHEQERDEVEVWSFDFETYKEHVEAPKSPSDASTLLLQTGVRKVNTSSPFASNYLIPRFSDTKTCLEELGDIIRAHLQFAESYEVLWDDDRKAREDEQTQYGTHLATLDQQVRELWDQIFIKKRNKEEGGKGQKDIPPLRPYLEEMVFGHGRSPKSLQAYIEKELIPSLGATVEERRANRKQNQKLVVVERIREYMRVWTPAQVNKEQYSNTLADLVNQWYNLLVDFKTSLAESYAKQDRPTDFPKASLNVLDMDHPSNDAILRNYTAFHQQYTQTGTPVVLSNVDLSANDLTMDYILEQCGHMDVTAHVKTGSPIGTASTKNWAGLQNYRLHKALAYDDRKLPGSNEEEEETSWEDAWMHWDIDETLTLEQFVAISEHVPMLYLYEASILGACESLLYETTLYGEQVFQLPKVMAAYDLTQRVIWHPGAHDSPSFTLGNRGSHAKLRTESKGYFLYLVEGRKRWTIYHPSERPYLYPRVFADSFIPDVLGMDLEGLETEAKQQLSKRFPLLHRTEQVYELVQEPGQLLYIPPNCPFAEENLQDGTLGLAIKVVPEDAAFGAYLHERIHRGRDFGYIDMALKYRLFEDTANHPSRGSEFLYMSFADYKAQR